MLLQRLLKAGAPAGTHDYDGRTALHIAAAEGHMGAVCLLLVHRVHVQSQRYESEPSSLTQVIPGAILEEVGMSVKNMTATPPCTLLLLRATWARCAFPSYPEMSCKPGQSQGVTPGSECA